MTVKGVLWHSTGANNPTLKRYVQPSDDAKDREEMLKYLGVNQYGNDWNHIYREAGLNAWIGKTAAGGPAVVQTMPWDYKPWGCGAGSKGSCNDGWIQFEICEDDLNNEVYFNQVYRLAVELTAYLCDMYNLDPLGKVSVNGIKVPVITCHAESYQYGMGGNHGDPLHWFVKYGKDMEDVRNDVKKVLDGAKKTTTSTTKPTESKPATSTSTSEMYRVRKTWADAASQIGAYTVLDNAKKACDKAGSGYEVYDSKGNVVYPKTTTTSPTPATTTTKPATTTSTPKVGDVIKLTSTATYHDGGVIPNWVKNSTLYLREIRANGDYVISTQKSGAITGVVKPSSVEGGSTTTSASKFPYLVEITADALNVRAGAGTNYKVNTVVKKKGVYTIVGEQNGWGKLKSGAGWIDLSYTRRL
jgi:hypothetical protein